MNVKLPTKKSVPETGLHKYVVLIYGRPKVGKTTLAAQFEDPLFIMFEPGARSLSLHKLEATTWSKFTKIIEQLAEEPDRFKTVVVDTFARAYELCLEHVCKQMNIDHPTDAPYGKAWVAVDREFTTWMNRLALSGRGLILICHAQDKDIEQPDGTLKSMTTPETTKQGMKFLDRAVDLYCYYYYGKNGKRYIRVKGTEDVVAGNRIDGHFEKISKFRAGSSAAETYKLFLDAFENKIQEEK